MFGRPTVGDEIIHKLATWQIEVDLAKVQADTSPPAKRRKSELDAEKLSAQQQYPDDDISALIAKKVELLQPAAKAAITDNAVPAPPDVKTLIEDLSKYARQLHTLHNSCTWSTNDFQIRKAALFAIVSDIAYWRTQPDELQRRTRATLVPSNAFQMLLSQPPATVNVILAGADLDAVEFVRGRNYVASVVKMGTRIFVGVRGSVFAFDWFINLDVRRTRAGQHPGYFHRGFYIEALFVEYELVRLLEARNWSYDEIYFTGHSLGGAVATILGERFQQKTIFATPKMSALSSCYTFAAPRIGNLQALLASTLNVYAMQRDLDIVPVVPPKFLGFSSFIDRRAADGTPFERSVFDRIEYFHWLLTLNVYQFFREHFMERYLVDIQRKNPSLKEFASCNFDRPPKI